MKYADEFFDYQNGYSNYDSSQIFIVDRKGNKFTINGDDIFNSSNSSHLVEGSPGKVTNLANLTEWFPYTINPVRTGQYEIEALEKVVWPNFPITSARWNGKVWKDEDGKVIAIKSWRGLSSQLASD